MKTELAFALAVYKVELNNGKIDFKLHSQNNSLPDEMMLTLVQQWLRKMNDLYYDQLPDKFLL